MSRISEGRSRRAGRAAARQPQKSRIVYNLPVYDLLSDDDVRRLDQASMRILSEFGIAFYDSEARSILKAHGARVDGDMVYFDPDLIREYVTKAPSEFTQLARNPSDDLFVSLTLGRHEHHQVTANSL